MAESMLEWPARWWRLRLAALPGELHEDFGVEGGAEALRESGRLGGRRGLSMLWLAEGL